MELEEVLEEVSSPLSAPDDATLNLRVLRYSKGTLQSEPFNLESSNDDNPDDNYSQTIDVPLASTSTGGASDTLIQSTPVKKEQASFSDSKDSPLSPSILRCRKRRKPHEDTKEKPQIDPKQKPKIDRKKPEVKTKEKDIDTKVKFQ